MKLGVLGLVVAVSWAAQSVAQDCKKPAPPGDADAVLRVIVDKNGTPDCYAVTTNPEPDPSLNDAAKMLSKAAGQTASSEKLQTLAGLLQWMREWLTAGLDDAALRETLQRKVSDAQAALALADLSNEVIQPPSWIVVGRPGRMLTSRVVPKDYDINTPIRKSCGGKPEDEKACNNAIANVESVLRMHATVELALKLASGTALADLTDLFAKRAKMWDAYRTEARPQYPWEWVFNGVLFKDERVKDASGNPRGPANLPRGQWILFHPGVGLERFDIRGTSNSASNPTLYIEWAGYNRLDWDYDAGKLRGGLGMSLVSVYASRQDAKDWSNGVMFWVSNKYGLAVTRNGDGTSVMVSVDVGELFRDQLNQLNQAIRVGLPSK